MKHGDKAKGKAAKVSSKASVKKTSKTGGPPRKATKALKGGKSVKTVQASPGPGPAKGPAGREAGRPKAGATGRSGVDPVSFSNPAIAAAFKRAVKKYANAFRRLTE